MATPVATSPPPATWFSLRGISHYARWKRTSLEEARVAERRLLEHSGCVLEVEDVPCGDTREHYMHTVIGGDVSKANLVCTAGYGAGLGFFYRNLSFFVENYRTFAVDLLGCGLSGRPSFRAKTREEAEDFFVDALERWRIEKGLTDIILLGHSLGAYLSTCYAMKYPGHVKKLVLVCPAGINERPNDLPFRKSYAWKTFSWAWNKGVTPGMIIRFCGPVGPSLCRRYTQARFASQEKGWNHGEGLPEESLDNFASYMYHVLAQKGSGEHALRHLLLPGAWARAPLQNRMHQLDIPLTFIYGEKDWMDWKAGERVCQSTGRRENMLYRIERSGHYTFLDHPGAFNNLLGLVLQRYQNIDMQEAMDKVENNQSCNGAA